MENHDLQYWVIVFSQLIGKFGNFFVAILVSLVLYGIYLTGTDGNMGILSLAPIGNVWIVVQQYPIIIEIGRASCRERV